MFPLPLNSQNLPYSDPIHPIVVHFVAMVFFSFVCDVVGYSTRNARLFEVGFWNVFIGAIPIFAAIIFGQFEAGLAQVYPAVQPILNFHTVMGWSLGAIVAVITTLAGCDCESQPAKVASCLPRCSNLFNWSRSNPSVFGEQPVLGIRITL
jgi:uncharacterized membrane protein